MENTYIKDELFIAFSNNIIYDENVLDNILDFINDEEELLVIYKNDWNMISTTKRKLSDNFVMKYSDKLNFNIMRIMNNISPKMLEKYL